jgi:hypothetical protein
MAQRSRVLVAGSVVLIALLALSGMRPDRQLRKIQQR